VDGSQFRTTFAYYRRDLDRTRGNQSSYLVFGRGAETAIVVNVGLHDIVKALWLSNGRVTTTRKEPLEERFLGEPRATGTLLFREPPHFARAHMHRCWHESRASGLSNVISHHQ